MFIIQNVYFLLNVTNKSLNYATIYFYTVFVVIFAHNNCDIHNCSIFSEITIKMYIIY